MPKNKTHSGASKRFKVTGTGKLRRMQTGRKSGAAFASAPTTGSRKKHRQKSGMVDVAHADVQGSQEASGSSDPPDHPEHLQGVTRWHASSGQ